MSECTAHTHPLLIQNGRFDEGPKSNSITAGFKFIVARNHSSTSDSISVEGEIMPAQSSLSTRRSTTTAVEPDELVPSRYAQKVGAIDVLVISDGVLQIPAVTIAHNIEPAVRAAWLEHEFLSPEMLEWPLNVAVVRSGDRTILIDAGT